MTLWFVVVAASLVVASAGAGAAPVQHYGYDFHVTSNNELEPLAQRSYDQIEPVYVREPAYYQTPTSVSPHTQRESQVIRRYSSGEPSTGTWSWGYDTNNGITFFEEGHLQNSSSRNQQGPSPVVRGMYSYTGPDGVRYTVTYYADETGFHPSGAHLPPSAL